MALVSTTDQNKKAKSKTMYCRSVAAFVAFDHKKISFDSINVYSASIKYVSQSQRPILYAFVLLGIRHLQRGRSELDVLWQSARTRRSTEHQRGGDRNLLSANCRRSKIFAALYTFVRRSLHIISFPSAC